MASTTLTWRSLGINTLRMVLCVSKDSITFHHRPFITSHITGIGAKLRPVAKLSYAFSLLHLSKETLLNAPPPEKLSHEYMISQASNSAAASSQQLLTLTLAAIVDIAGQYRKCMEQLMTLMETTVEIPANSPQESLWDEVVALRIKVEEMKKRLRDLSSFMEYVDKVTMGSAEVSYFAGAEHVSSSLCDLLNTAHAKIKDEYEKTRYCEQEFLNAQKEFIGKACELEKHLKQRESEVRQKTTTFYQDQLPKADECRG